VLLAIPVLMLLGLGEDFPTPLSLTIADGSYFSELDQTIAERLPVRTRLRQLNLWLGLLSGQQEQNDIFISKNGLIKNIEAAGPGRIQQNVAAIRSFADRAQVPTYLTVIPTSSAILQQQLPPYAEIYNNQRKTIDEINRGVSGAVTVADVYPALFARRDSYIYYRTENNLTALGGYHVYSALAPKLLGQEMLEFSHFDIKYLQTPYYGDLYQKSPYQGVSPDTLSLYRYTRYARDYTVTHYGPQGVKTYHTLYPTHLADLGEPMNVYFGGVSAVTKIQVSSPYLRSLLIFGDKTALSYLPFLANSYEQITLVDLFQLTPALAKELAPKQYDQILFAYSIETFDTNIPQRALQLLAE